MISWHFSFGAFACHFSPEQMYRMSKNIMANSFLGWTSLLKRDTLSRSGEIRNLQGFAAFGMSHKTSPTLAVHLHLHYLDMWGAMRGYLENIGELPYYLFVTLTSKCPAIEEQIRVFHPQCEVHVVENRGYDIGAFVYFLHHIDLEEYDVILKVHAKDEKGGSPLMINHCTISRQDWAQRLMSALLGSRKVFCRNLEAFRLDERLGMLGSRYLLTSKYTDAPEVRRGVELAMQELGHPVPEEITFIAGAIFMVRSSVLHGLKATYRLSDFAGVQAGVKDGTLAHILERVIGCYTLALGYKVRGVGGSFAFSAKLLLRRMLRFVYQSKMTSSKHLIIKIFKVPVIYLRKS